MPGDDRWLLDPTYFGKASESSSPGPSTHRSVPVSETAHTHTPIAQAPISPPAAANPTGDQIKSVFSNVWSRAQTVVESAKDKLSTSAVAEKIRAPPAAVSAEDKELSKPSKPIVVTLSDNLRAAFPFASYADSYCVFGSFRRRTSRLTAYADRPFEAVYENMDRVRLGRLIARDFAAHSSVADASSVE